MRRWLALFVCSLVLSSFGHAAAEGVRILAVRGLDPVALCAGSEIAGSEAIVGKHGRYDYRFVSAENRATFEQDPERFGIQWGGGCGRMGPLSGAGSAERFAVVEGRIWIFASDACRTAFSNDPKAYQWVDCPELSADGDAKRGRECFEKMIAALGGAARFDALETYSEVFAYRQPSQGKDYPVTESFRMGKRLGARLASSWDQSEWGYVLSASGAFSTSAERGSEDLVPAQRRELERQIHHTLLAIVLSRVRPDFVVQYAGDEVTGETKSDLLRVRFDGQITEIALDAETALPRSLRYRGRLEIGKIGDVRIELADWREVSGLKFPHARTSAIDGKVAEKGKFVGAIIEVDEELAPALFAR